MHEPYVFISSAHEDAPFAGKFQSMDGKVTTWCRLGLLQVSAASITNGMTPEVCSGDGSSTPRS